MNQIKIIKGKPYLCITLFAVTILLVWLLDKWFFPWLGDFSSRAHCIEIFGFNGSIVLFFSIFIGTTFLFFLLTFWLFLVEKKKIKTGLDPAPDSLVCRDTVVQPYKISSIRKFLVYMSPFLGVGMIIYGTILFSDFKTDIINQGIKKDDTQCNSRDNKPFKKGAPDVAPFN